MEHFGSYADFYDLYLCSGLRFSEGKFGPLLKTRNAVVIYSRGQTYAEHSPTPASLFDHQKGYIDFWASLYRCRKDP
jgi:hypothetical protein